MFLSVQFLLLLRTVQCSSRIQTIGFLCHYVTLQNYATSFLSTNLLRLLLCLQCTGYQICAVPSPWAAPHCSEQKDAQLLQYIALEPLFFNIWLKEKSLHKFVKPWSKKNPYPMNTIALGTIKQSVNPFNWERLDLFYQAKVILMYTACTRGAPTHGTRDAAPRLGRNAPWVRSVYYYSMISKILDLLDVLLSLITWHVQYVHYINMNN